jgi:hypothetical protein
VHHRDIHGYIGAAGGTRRQGIVTAASMRIAGIHPFMIGKIS